LTNSRITFTGAKVNQLKESMAVSHLKRNPIFDGQMTEFSIKNPNKLIFNRVLGHKLDCPGEGQW
jgi:hypothetical protein